MGARFIVGDVLDVLPTLEAGSVDLVLSSPPFLALRSYLPSDHPLKAKEGGSQPTPGAFIDWLVDVVEALDRVLAPHGSICIELGDTYATEGGPSGDSRGIGLLSASREGAMPAKGPMGRRLGWPASKSLALIPELFRMTLVYGFNPLTGRQTKRWRLRNVVRWVRPNPPVGALGDKFRSATSELMVFCRTDEAGRKRYFDLDAVREPHKSDPAKFTGNGYEKGRPEGFGVGTVSEPGNPAGAPPLDWWNIPLLDGEEETPYGKQARQRKDGERSGTGPKTKNDDGSGAGWAWERTLINNPLGAPPLDWWEIPPGGYQGAHYAVMPEALCVKPIKAMCPERVCRTCGESSRRIVENGAVYQRDAKDRKQYQRTAVNAGRLTGTGASFERADYQTLGWSDCGHDNYRPGLVLDPFAGSGTTLAVAVGHGRDALGIDLDERNLELARGRLGMFLEAAS